MRWSRGYRILDQDNLQKGKHQPFSVIIVLVIILPVVDENRTYSSSPSPPREKAISDFKSLEINALEFELLKAWSLPSKTRKMSQSLNLQMMSSSPPQKKERPASLWIKSLGSAQRPSAKLAPERQRGATRNATTDSQTSFVERTNATSVKEHFYSRKLLHRRIRAAHLDDAREESNPPSSSTVVQTGALIEIPSSLFCNLCFKRDKYCIYEPFSSDSAIKALAYPAVLPCCATGPVLSGESAVE
jgi:hypothetical protein